MKEKSCIFKYEIMKHLTILLIILSFISCGSKKKITEREKVKIETSENTKVSQNETKETKTDSNSTKEETRYSVSEDNVVQLTQADPNKEITLIDSQGRETKIKGANAIISTRKEEKKEDVKETVVLSKIDKSETDINFEQTKKETIEKNSRNTNTEIERGFPWWILILIGVVYLVVSYFRKTLNPLGWIKF